MKLRILVALAAVTALPASALQQGQLFFQNTTDKPVIYQFSSELSGSFPELGVDFGQAGGTLNGAGTIASQTKSEIISGMWLGDSISWGDTINFKIGFSENNLKPFAITTLGNYVISADNQGTITVTPQ